MKKNKEMEKIIASDAGKKADKKQSKFVSFINSRQAKRGIIAIVLTVIFIAIVVGLNIVTTLLTAKYSSLNVDLTPSDVYKLTDDTVKQLEKLDKEVNVFVLTTEANLEAMGGYYVQVNMLIHEIDKASEFINLEYIDLASNPSFTSKYKDINWYSSTNLMLIEHGDNYLTVSPDDVFTYEQDSTTGEYQITGQKVEQATLTAILNVITEEKVGVAFLEVNTQVDNSTFKTMLSNNAYDVSEISLLSDEIPESCKFVVIFAPTNDIDKQAYDTLTKWLNNNGNYGHTLIYVPDSTIKIETPNIDTLLEEWNMALTDGWVFETNQQFMYLYTETPQLTTLYGYDSTDFTANLHSTSVPVIMDRCMPVEILNSGATSMLATSDAAVVLPFDADDSWTPDDAEPQKLIGAAISTQGNEDNTKSSNVIVIGSYASLSNYFLTLSSANNSTYFINLFNTLSERDDISITIEGKTLDKYELGIADASTANIIIILVRYIVPIAVVAVGIVMWIRRRHK